MKKLCILLVLALVMSGARAEDFGMWTGVGFGQNLGVKGLDANLDLGFRSNNSLRNVDRWNAGLGLSYALCPNLKIGANYTYIYSYTGAENKPHYKADTDIENGRNITRAYWRSKNRFSFDAKGDIDVGRFNFSLRERYQLTGYNRINVIKDKFRTPIYDENNTLVGYQKKETETDTKQHKCKEYLRSKLEASYNIRHCPLEPSVSVEFENNLREAFKLDEVRYVAGFDWKISKKVHLGAYYHFNSGHDDDGNEDLHAIEISMKFKNLFWKAKK